MVQAFRQANLDSPEADARLLLGHALHLDRSGLMSEANRMLEAREVDAVSALAARRLKHEPVARIFGAKEFWSLTLDISEAVLVPRPDTETVVEAALDFVGRAVQRLEKLRVLDIGTGSGALLLALLSELPNAIGTGTDISEPALAIARANAERHGLGGRCSFVACDMAAPLQGPFDLIVSNPPYVAHGEIASLAPEVRDYDPAIALDGGPAGLDSYRAIAAGRQQPSRLGGNRAVTIETGRPAVERNRRVVIAHLRRQRRNLVVRDIRRVRHDQLERSGQAIRDVAFDETAAR